MESMPTNQTQTLLVASLGTAAALLIYYFMGGFGSKPTKKETDKTDTNNKKPTADSKAKENVVDDKFPAGPLIVYFGSQTGTAEGFARQLVKETKAKGFNAKMIDLEEFDEATFVENRHSGISLFLMATYGEGEPTDNAVKFTKWLRNADEETPASSLSTQLEGFRFSVFGLGNRQYEHFNKMGKLVDTSLAERGGVRAFSYGEGDDDGSLEEDFENWKKSLIPRLLRLCHPAHAGESEGDEASLKKEAGKEEDLMSTPEVEFQFSVKVVPSTSSTSLSSSSSNPLLANASSAQASARHYFTSAFATVTVNRELRQKQGEGESTRHIELDISSAASSAEPSQQLYVTADNCAILPLNNQEDVAKFAAQMGYNPKDLVVLEQLAGSTESFKHPFPTPSTVDEILSSYLDLSGIPRHSTLVSLIPYVGDATEKKWLCELLSEGRRKDFSTACASSDLSFFGLARTLSSLKLSLAALLHLAPPLQPRYYTLASSAAAAPAALHLTVGLSFAKIAPLAPISPLCKGDDAKDRVNGVCSSYLVSLSPGTKLRYFIRPSSFRLPESLNVPIIMIGPGTGIAPMRALLQERKCRFEAEKKKRTDAGDLSEVEMTNVLFFGCRRSDEDYLYKDELEAYQKEKLVELHLAFSRETKDKVYVQHLMRRTETSRRLLALIDQGAFVFVCGATAMGEEVGRALADVCGGDSAVAGAERLKKLQAEGRYVQELWTA